MKTKGIFLVINEKNETFSLTKIRPKKSTFGRRKKKKRKGACFAHAEKRTAQWYIT
jgi:hypothetical protein